MTELARPWPLRAVMAMTGYAAVYLVLAAVSASTAFVQVNTAAVWLPSGFAVGLLTMAGYRFWPAVFAGSFIFNASINLASHAIVSPVAATIVAACIATGNTGEALLGAYLANRFASGRDFMFHVQSTTIFVVFVASLPPLVSTLIGVAASHFGGLTPAGTIFDVALTWYIGNYTGIMVFAGITILALAGSIGFPPRGRIGEALALTVCLCFAGQAIGGYFLTGWIGDWLKSYMIIPLLLWACFRFGVAAALLSIALVTGISVIGALRGYAAFPSNSAKLELVYLQIFVGMLSAMTLAISASLAELKGMRATLEDRVKSRTKEVEQLMREREVFTTLVAHDLQSPLYGVRNALRASSAAISENNLSVPDLTRTLGVMEQTCTTLAERVASLLISNRDLIEGASEPKAKPLIRILENIASVHGAAIGTPGARLTYRGDRALAVTRAAEVEHIVDALIDNALKYSPADKPVDIAAFRHGGWIEIHVVDRGPGLTHATRTNLFRSGTAYDRGSLATKSGLGLYLASEKANELGGRLSYTSVVPAGAAFRLVVPA